MIALVDLNELRKKYAINKTSPIHDQTQSVPQSTYSYVAQILQQPVVDGRHRLLWLVLAPYLINVMQLPEDVATDILNTYLSQCEALYSTDAKSKVEYYIRYAKNTGLKPPHIETLKEKYPDLYSIVIDIIK